MTTRQVRSWSQGGYQLDDAWEPSTGAINTGTEEEDDIQAELKRAAYEALLAASAAQEADKRKLVTAKERAEDKMKQIKRAESDLEGLRKQRVNLDEQIAKQDGDVSARDEYYDAQKKEVETAKTAVQQITDAELYELRAYKNPAELIKRFAKALNILLNDKTYKDDLKCWIDTKKMIGKKTFIPRLIDFDTNTITESQRVKIEDLFGNREDFNFENLNNASKAAGSIADFVQAEVEFSALLHSRSIWEKEIETSQRKVKGYQRQVKPLEKKIAGREGELGDLKAQYQSLLMDYNALKADLTGGEEQPEAGVVPEAQAAAEPEVVEQADDDVQPEEEQPGDAVEEAQPDDEQPPEELQPWDDEEQPDDGAQPEEAQPVEAQPEEAQPEEAQPAADGAGDDAIAGQFEEEPQPE